MDSYIILTLVFPEIKKKKKYVQHILIEKQSEVYEWIMNGAHIYLCGHTHMGMMFGILYQTLL